MGEGGVSEEGRGGVLSIFSYFNCAKRISSLEDRVAKLESEMKDATLDYLNLYGKAKKLFGRVAKAQSRIEAAEEEAEETPSGAATTSAQGVLPMGGMMTARQKEIQQQILRRRAGG